MIKLLNSKETITTLNALGPLYHSTFGFHPRNKDDTTFEFCTDNHDLIEWYEDYCDSTAIEEDLESKEITIFVNLEQVFSHARNVVPYQNIIIKYQCDQWKNMPDFYYNRRSSWWSQLSPDSHLNNYILPFLNTCTYITVFQSFMEVHLSRDIKGSRLTINDILFATRALLIDDCRTINYGYTVIQNTPDTLIIEPQVDSG
jgi:hypothetical protein